MANRVALYLAQNGASVYMRFLLSSFAALCSMLMIYGIGVTVMCGILIALALDDKQGPPVQPGGAELQLWYLCIMLGFLGVGSILASGAGILAASRFSIPVLNSHLIFLAVTLAGELCASVAETLLSSKDDPQAFLAQPSGHAAAGSALAASLSTGSLDSGAALSKTEFLAAKAVGAAGLALQVLVLTLGCLLQTALSQVDEAAEDAEEEYEGAALAQRAAQRSSLHRPLLAGSPGAAGSSPGRGSPPGPGSAEADEWRRHMQERYGLDVSVFTYDPRRQGYSTPPQLGPSNGSGEGAGGAGRGSSSRCSIM